MSSNAKVLVLSDKSSALRIAVAQRGPAGPAGSGAGVNYLTDAEPAGAERELWFNHLTQSLQVHDGSGWKGLIPDGGYF
jgi:hypothetical protein